jgi:hypothetical protein
VQHWLVVLLLAGQGLLVLLRVTRGLPMLEYLLLLLWPPTHRLPVLPCLHLLGLLPLLPLQGGSRLLVPDLWLSIRLVRPLYRVLLLDCLLLVRACILRLLLAIMQVLAPAIPGHWTVQGLRRGGVTCSLCLLLHRPGLLWCPCCWEEGLLLPELWHMCRRQQLSAGACRFLLHLLDELLPLVAVEERRLPMRYSSRMQDWLLLDIFAHSNSSMLVLRPM